MRATLTKERFSDPQWIYERKLDGVRCVAVRDGGPVKLLSRNDLSLNGRYPEIASALEKQATKRFAIDGEVVAFDGSETSFARLAQRGRHYVPVFYYVFDVLWLDGVDVRGSRCGSESGCCARRSSSVVRSASRPIATSTARRSMWRLAARAGRG